jgi:GNAT superfamily N-acetyltransferase
MSDETPVIREARRADVSAIVELLARDALGATRESTDGAALDDYVTAFEAIDADANNELIVVDRDGAVVGCLQLTYIPGLSRGGMTRALIEAVRVAESERGHGLGRRLFEWAIARARERGCGLVQLTTDKQRADAHRFYESLGFVASHHGMKLPLPRASG